MGAILLSVGFPSKEYLLFDNMTDEEIVYEAANDDHGALEYLINKYKILSNAKLDRIS